MAYDLDDGWMWRLPGDVPWGERYIEALAELNAGVTWECHCAKQERLPRRDRRFDRDGKSLGWGEFITEILDDAPRAAGEGVMADAMPRLAILADFPEEGWPSIGISSPRCS